MYPFWLRTAINPLDPMSSDECDFDSGEFLSGDCDSVMEESHAVSI